MVINLTEMKPGQSGVIVELKGGFQFTERLGQLGLRKGKKVKKVSSVFKRSPVIVCIDKYQVAIGYGKAVRVLVEVTGNG